MPWRIEPLTVVRVKGTPVLFLPVEHLALHLTVPSKVAAALPAMSSCVNLTCSDVFCGEKTPWCSPNWKVLSMRRPRYVPLMPQPPGMSHVEVWKWPVHSNLEAAPCAEPAHL